MTDTKLEQLCSLLSSGELRVQAIAAVVVWTFAQQKHTLLRMPFHVAVPALLDQLLEEEIAVKRMEVMPRAAAQGGL